MSSPPVLQLNIWCNDQCIVQLSWGERQQLSAKLPYPTSLMQLYQDWQRLYLHVYPSSSRGRIATEGSLTPPVDWWQQLQEAEQALLEHMQRWLGGEELLAIRRKIQGIATQTQAHAKAGEVHWIKLLIACDHPQMIRLPWEAWQIVPPGSPLGLIRIYRTPITVSEVPVPSSNGSRTGRPRILAILADASELNLQADRKAVRSLAQVAVLELVELNPQEQGISFKQRLTAKLMDDRGWDLLIFAGHSDETPLTGGRLHLARDISLSISEIEPELRQAQQRGLQVAIFNSCSGLSLAQSLLQLGLHQVVVMRERIHDRVAQVFLTQVCQQLAAYQDLYQSVLTACTHFKSEQITYPSAALIPSLFCHPQADSFQFQRSRWRRLWRDWQPTRAEAIAVSLVLLVSLPWPVRDLLMDARTLIEAIYRDYTHQLAPNQQPPVQLIAIDQSSINEAIDQSSLNDLEPLWPHFTYEDYIDRRYLAALIKRLSQLHAKTIGIDYELYVERPHNEDLNQAIESAVKQKTWLVFATSEQEQKRPHPHTASPNWSLQGDIWFFPRFVNQPHDVTCQRTCPFAYLLALSHHLNQESSAAGIPQPDLQNRTIFQKQLSDSLKEDGGQLTLASLQRALSPLPWPSAIMDFSIPPHQIYNRVLARDLLDGSPPTMQPYVALIAAEGYKLDGDVFSTPLAMRYWCNASQYRQSQPGCNIFTGGKAHAYMVHHILKSHRVILIPDIWMIGLATLLGKWATLSLQQQDYQRRRTQRVGLAMVPLGYGIIGLQVYISAALAMPWFWPSLMFWMYLSIFRRKSNG